MSRAVVNGDAQPIPPVHGGLCPAQESRWWGSNSEARASYEETSPFISWQVVHRRAENSRLASLSVTKGISAFSQMRLTWVCEHSVGMGIVDAQLILKAMNTYIPFLTRCIQNQNYPDVLLTNFHEHRNGVAFGKIDDYIVCFLTSSTFLQDSPMSLLYPFL